MKTLLTLEIVSLSAFSEPVDANSVNIQVTVAKTEESLSEPTEGMLSGTVSGSGDSVTFTADMPMRCGRMYSVTISGATDMAGNALVDSHSFSFSTTSPELVKSYHVKEEDIQDENGEAALRLIASRPEIFDDPEKWTRLVAGNQDDYIFDRTRLSVGQHLWIKRGPAWGDK